MLVSLLGSTLSVVVISANASSGQPAWTSSTVPTVGLNPPAGNQVYLPGISCAAPGVCVVVGYYSDSSGDFYGLIESYSNGTWRAQNPPMTGLNPPADLNPTVVVGLYNISCPTLDICVAVGDYADTSGNTHGLIETYSNGTWSAQTAPTSGLNPSAIPTPHGVVLFGLSCSSSSFCEAVGYYHSTATPVNAPMTVSLIETDSNGTWTAQTAPSSGVFATSVNPAGLLGVSCPTSVNCFAVGVYSSGSNPNNLFGYIETLTNGIWSAQGIPVAGLNPPAGTSAMNLDNSLGNISCPSPTLCVATGFYVDSNGGVDGLFETLENGAWSAQTAPATGLNPPEPSSPWYEPYGISCPSLESCVSVGFYYTSDTYGKADGLVEMGSFPPPPPEPSSTTLNISPNPSEYGNTITMKATVSGAGASPGGSITFYDGTTSLGVVGLTGDTATLTDSSLDVGTHEISANYSGFGLVSSSTAGPVGLVVLGGSTTTTTPTPTTTTVPPTSTTTSEPACNPEISQIAPTFGPSVGKRMVTIHGTCFQEVTGVDFGNNPATNFRVVNANLIEVISPAGTGTVSVTLGSSTQSNNPTAPQYTYEHDMGYSLFTAVGDEENFGTGHTSVLSSINDSGRFVAFAATPDGGGYWMVTDAGQVETQGNALFEGDLSTAHLAEPIVSMAATPDGGGYWLVGGDGGVFSFGDAGYYGSANSGVSGRILDIVSG